LKDNPNIDESDPAEQPMELSDYGIIDTLNAQDLTAIDNGLIEGVTAENSCKVSSLVARFMESSAVAIPGVPDYFYLLRIEKLVDTEVLRLVNDAGLLMRSTVRLA
jgi:hypothetical protein